jgi:hypothetical protein
MRRGPCGNLDAMSDASSPELAHSERELRREALTMALYVGLSILAVIITLPVANEHDDNRVKAGLTVLITGIGLVLAHHVAFRLSTRLVNEGVLTPESVEALAAQALGGLTVAVLAAIPVFVFGESPGEGISAVVLLALVAVVGYRSARKSASVVRSLVYVGVVVLAVALVLAVKLVAGH